MLSSDEQARGPGVGEVRVDPLVLDSVCRISGAGGFRKSLRVFRRNRSMLTAQALEGYLEEHPELPPGWLGYSGDKRTSHGYYFDRQGDGWIVGTLEPTHSFDFYTSEAKACADFILRELDCWARVTCTTAVRDLWRLLIKS